MTLLTTHALQIGYTSGKHTRVLQHDVQLSLRAGEVVSMIGQNGVGKTTLIRTLTGLLRPIGGSIMIQGKELKTLPATERAKYLSVVLTERSTSGNFTVRELIALGRSPYNNWLGILSTADQRAVSDAIDQTQLNYLTDRPVHELSDGQFQKVMIARALAQQTDIIILDEPTSHLDLSNKIEVMLLLRKIANQGKAVLISTHDLTLSHQISDSFWLLNFNASVQVGIPEDLILSGALSRALHLETTGYDFMHSAINLEGTSERKVKIIGDVVMKHWTCQVLSKLGFQIADSAQLSIECKQAGNWIVKNDKSLQTFESLSALSAYIKKLA